MFANLNLVLLSYTSLYGIFMSASLTLFIYTGFVIDSKLHPSRTCKTSLVFAPLAVRVQGGCSAIPFYTQTKPLIRLYFK